MVKSELNRTLGLFQVTIAGVGIILGAGIYALLGVAAQYSGNATWLAFFISSLVALFTGLSYAKLSSIYRGDAGEYDYVKDTVGKKFAFLIGLSMIAAGIVSASTVALGFAGYFTSIVPIPFLLGALLLIVLMTLINFIGIKQSTWFNTVSTFIEFAGLILIIILGIKYFGSVNYFEMPQGFSGVFSSAALVFFAYMGFESIIKLSEETINPEKTIPRAIILSIIITTIVYVLVAVSAVSIIGWEALASSTAPLASVAKAALGNGFAGPLLVIIALFSTANTVLITMVATSRQMYGMAKEKSLPKSLSIVHGRTRTPWVAILWIGVITIIFALIGDIEFIANLTNLFLFLTFGAVNLSLLLMAKKFYFDNSSKNKIYKIGKGFIVCAFIGLLSSLLMLGYVVINLI